VTFAEGGRGFLLTGEFLVKEKERKSVVALKVGTLIPRLGFSRRR